MTKGGKFGGALGALAKAKAPRAAAGEASSVPDSPISGNQENPNAGSPENPISGDQETQASGQPQAAGLQASEILLSGNRDILSSGNHEKQKSGKQGSQEGDPPQRPQREKYSTILDSGLVTQLKMYAVQNRMKDSQVVEAALRAYLRNG
ncbi:hypothetical protein [Deinococcus hopiensis]|uniref:Uncharacterized protein n=1 Tax=Deinococcus hopiensis KR-140 TaxID=695939 RepID=A0A1W1VUR3_9DEIO|nr:hypothetical protein [Deinococcus hopiensis]SMB97098.1 hypothetical protein SAMN00790413_06339 [Deinococcus hopiensis KR-140]